MARTTLAERKQAIIDEQKRLNDALKEIERKEKDAERAAQKRRVELAGKAILALAESKDEHGAKLYKSVMALLDAKLDGEDDRELFELDDKDNRDTLGLAPRGATPPEAPAKPLAA